MKWAPIPKGTTTANLQDYDRTYREFSWETEKRSLSGLPGGRGLNIAYEAVDRHAAGPRAGRTALRWLDRHDEVHEFTYAELAERTNRFANLLDGLGVRPGDRVFTLLGRVPDLYVAALGDAKARVESVRKVRSN